MRCGKVATRKGSVVKNFVHSRDRGFVAHHVFIGKQTGAARLMEISFAGYGRALRNPLHVAHGDATLVVVKALA